MDQKQFVEDSLSLGRPYPLQIFKGCLAQILLCPFWNTLTHMHILKISK